MSGKSDIVWQGVGTGRSDGFRLSVSRSETDPAQWVATAWWTAVNQRVIPSFAIAGPDDLRRVGSFLEDTRGKDLEERVQVVFGSLYGRPLRVVKNSPDRGGG